MDDQNMPDRINDMTYNLQVICKYIHVYLFPIGNLHMRIYMGTSLYLRNNIEFNRNKSIVIILKPIFYYFVTIC